MFRASAERKARTIAAHSSTRGAHLSGACSSFVFPPILAQCPWRVRSRDRQVPLSSRRLVHLAKMPCKASEFQIVLGVVKRWWKESFQEVLVDGKHALMDESPDEAMRRKELRYIILSCTARSQSCK